MKNRIVQLMHEKGLSRIEFAEKIGVQRSNISHILDGRNSPSLDFIEKVAKAYPGLNMNWLLKGEGLMFKKPEHVLMFREDMISPPYPERIEDKNIENPSDSEREINTEESIVDESISDIESTEPLIAESQRKEEIPVEKSSAYGQSIGNKPKNLPPSDDLIEKIVVFYSDKTYESYNPR